MYNKFKMQKPYAQLSYRYTPYSKMATILVFFCWYSNQPLLPRSKAKKSKEYFILNDARRANLNANKRILKW